MFNTNFSGHSRIWEEQKFLWGHCRRAPLVDTLQKFITWMKFIPNCDITYLVPVYMKLKIIDKMLTLLAANLKECRTSIFSWTWVIHFYHVQYLFLVYVRDSLNHIVIFFGPLWRHLWPNALGSHEVRPMVAPALRTSAYKQKLQVKIPC